MINELYALSLSLRKSGIDVPLKHPWIEGIKKGEALLVNVNSLGQVQNLEYCSPERVEMFWYIKESNKQTFPKINVDPLWSKINNKNLLDRVVSAGKEKHWEKWSELIDRLINTYPVIVCGDNAKKIKNWKKDKWGRIYNFPHELILPCLNDDNAGLRILISSFVSWKEFNEDIVNDFFIQIVKKLIADLLAGKLDCFKLAQDLIIGRPAAKQQPKVTVILNCSSQKIIVADRDEEKALSLALSPQTSGKGDYLCPLTGKRSESAVLKKYPNPKLPVIGNTSLMAMNKAADCHYRYGKKGVQVFSTSTVASSHLDNVLRYITAEERRNKTWMPVASGQWEGNPKKEKKDLLIAYAEDVPAVQNENLALLLGGNSGGKQRFESTSSIVCDAFTKNRIADSKALLRFFVIRKIDEGRRQVILNDFCSFMQLGEAVNFWNDAARNHPAFSIYLSTKKGVKASKHLPPVPFPADLPRLLQHQWIREGTEFHKLNGCSLLLAHDLFFERGVRTKSTARQALQMLVSRVMPLLIGVGRAQQLKTLSDYSILAKNATLQAVSFIGIVLFKLGYKKEDYMKEAGYLIGRLLSLTDCLHREYCKKVRKGEIPNQLLGNSILRTVLDNPTQGLARLSERISVYKAWVDGHYGEEYKLAHWAAKELGKITEKLSDIQLPVATDDAQKAQILLGYLAHTEQKSK